MAFSQAQLDAIESAIASGSLSVSYEGKQNTFRSLNDMLRIRSIIQRALGIAQPSATVLASHDRGFGGTQSQGFDDSTLYTGW